MDFLLILTIIGFLISFYSISEDYKKRNLVFKFNTFDKILMVSFFILLIIVIFIQDFYSIQEPEPTYSLFKIDFTYSFLLSIVAFFIATVIVVFFILKLNSKKLNQKEKFIENALDNLRKRRYSDLSADLDIFHKDILKNYKIPKESFDIFEHILSEKQSKNTDFKDKLKTILNKLNFIRNRKIRYYNLLDNFYNELVNDEDFIQYVAKNNLNIALRLLNVQQNPFNKEKLWNKVGRYLIKNKDSRLYLELNDEYSSNKHLLNFLFKDTSKCAEFLVWKPIGDFVIEYIENQNKKKEDENNYHESNYDLVKQKSPIYIGIRFFDYMVKTALKQNTADHMWLYYVGYFVEKMLRNIEYEKGARGEFVSMYEYYIYEIFSSYKDWITYSINNNNYTVEYNENGSPNIIQNAIDSFVFAMYDVQKSDKLRDDFKSYLREIFIDTYFELATCNKSEIDNYVEYFKKCLREKIQRFKEVDIQFVNFLKIPIDNPYQRNVWDRGLHYTMNKNNQQKLNDFKNFLDSFLSKQK